GPGSAPWPPPSVQVLAWTGPRALDVEARYLLRDAVDTAAPEENLARVDSDDHPVGAGALQDRGGLLVGARIEQRHDDATVGHVEIDIARRQPIASVAPLHRLARHEPACLLVGHVKRSGHRDLEDFQAPPLRV